jgi:hypothetical protein
MATIRPSMSAMFHFPHDVIPLYSVFMLMHVSDHDSHALQQSLDTNFYIVSHDICTMCYFKLFLLQICILHTFLDEMLIFWHPFLFFKKVAMGRNYS